MSKDVPLSLDLAALPNDAALLKQMLIEQCQIRDQLIERIRQEAAEQLQAELAEQRERLEAEKKAVVLALLRRFYGPKNESFDPRQLLLFGQRVETMPLDEKVFPKKQARRWLRGGSRRSTSMAAIHFPITCRESILNTISPTTKRVAPAVVKPAAASARK